MSMLRIRYYQHLKKTVVICDRFTDSTLAYQVYGKKVNLNFINSIQKIILENLNQI